MSDRRRWSLSNRLTGWLALVMVVPVVIATAVGLVFMRGAVQRELEALVAEELAEATVRVRFASRPAEQFAPIAAELAAQHDDIAMAWRLFDAESGAVLGEYGVVGILSEQALARDAGHSVEWGSSTRLSRSAVAPGGLVLGLTIDAPLHWQFFGRYRVLALLIALASGVAALLGARVVAIQVARLLARVANDLQDPHESTAAAAAGADIPAEIEVVAEALRRSLATVRREYEDSRVFTAGLAHELRSPIQNLIGEAEVALLRPRTPDAYREVLERQLQELAEFGDAVDNLLTICSTRASSAASERFDLGAEAELRLRRESARARREGVDLRLQSTGDLCVTGDREWLLRSLRNVVGNALHYSPRGAALEVVLDGSGRDVVITVDDAGPGIPAELQQRVLEPFFQGPARPDRRSGCGLGLAIAQRAVTMQGGSIEIGDSPLGGARVRLHIPREVARPAPGFDPIGSPRVTPSRAG